MLFLVPYVLLSFLIDTSLQNEWSDRAFGYLKDFLIQLQRRIKMFSLKLGIGIMF